MNIKTKISLVLGGIIAFILGWIFLLLSLLNKGADVQTDIHRKHTVLQTKKLVKQATQNNKISNVENKKNTKNTKKINHSFTVITVKWLNDKTAWKYFGLLYKKQTGGKIKVKYYDDLDKYNKDIIYKLATKSNDFDFAIIPTEWFKNTEQLSKLSFKLPNVSLQLSSLFDYNFKKYLQNNNIKAIPFALDPIVGYSIDDDIDTNLTYEKWKRIIITDPDRLTSTGKIKFMPIFLGYDKNYLNYIKKENKTLFPVFDYIINYYKFKKDTIGLELFKSFGTDITYKTFDFNLYKKNAIKLRKYSICKGNMMKYCLLASKKTRLVYGFVSDYNLIKKKQFYLFKYFKFKIKKLSSSSLAIPSFSEYPARGWVIIINPNSKNLKYMGTFLKTYIQLGQENKLPFYKNLISPFGANPNVNNEKFKFLKSYLGNMITFDKFGIGLKNNLNKKILNYLNGDISVNILIK